MLRFSILGMIFLCVGCASLVPATTPPQLFSTPGAFIRFDDDSVYSDAFAVDTPADWRIVRVSPASDPLHLVMVSVDDMMRIDVALSPLNSADAMAYVVQDQVQLGETIIYIMGQTAIDDTALFEAIYQQILDSIRLP